MTAALIVTLADPPVAPRCHSEQPDSTREDVLARLVTWPSVSGAAAAVIGRADRHPEDHPIVGSVARAGTEHR